jgi:uncharacterized protein (DUF1778 family)
MAKKPKQPRMHLAMDDAQLDRTLFSVSANAYAEFIDRLGTPPPPNDRLRRTMQEPSLWDCGGPKRGSV